MTVRVHKAYPNKITWLTKRTPYYKTLPKRALIWWTHGKMANCKKSTLKIWHVVNYSIQNLDVFKKIIKNMKRFKFFQTEILGVVFSWNSIYDALHFFNIKILKRCVFFTSKNDASYFLEIEIWGVVFFLNQNMTLFFDFKVWRVVFFFQFKLLRVVFFWFTIWRVLIFSIQIMTLERSFQFKIVFSKKARKKQIMPFSRSKLNQDVIFGMQTFFQNLICRKISNSKSQALFFFKSKSDALENISPKSDKF